MSFCSNNEFMILTNEYEMYVHNCFKNNDQLERDIIS